MPRATRTAVMFISRLPCSLTHRKELGSDPGWLWSRALGPLGQAALPLRWAMWNAGALTGLPQGSRSPGGWIRSEWLPFYSQWGTILEQEHCPDAHEGGVGRQLDGERVCWGALSPLTVPKAVLTHARSPVGILHLEGSLVLSTWSVKVLLLLASPDTPTGIPLFSENCSNSSWSHQRPPCFLNPSFRCINSGCQRGRGRPQATTGRGRAPSPAGIRSVRLQGWLTDAVP